jgi:hypothetical protein
VGHYDFKTAVMPVNPLENEHAGIRESGLRNGLGEVPGEFIREFHSDSSLRKKPVDRVLSGMIEYDGPHLYQGGEVQQRSFDSTCRKFRRFLSPTVR